MKIKTSIMVQNQKLESTDGRPMLPRELVVFQRMYLRLGAQKMSYFFGLRSLICLDGCFLKTMMGGHLLCAIGRDGNENMMPFAVAYVDAECKESWTWFLSLLLEDFGRPEDLGWVFMSD